jgi:hypothetical protein
MTTLKGKVSHFPNSSNGSVEFTFHKDDGKKKEVEVNIYNPISLPFEIWKKFKDSNVEITIKKLK